LQAHRCMQVGDKFCTVEAFQKKAIANAGSGGRFYGLGNMHVRRVIRGGGMLLVCGGGIMHAWWSGWSKAHTTSIDRNRGRQAWSKGRKTTCHVHCRKTGCKNAFEAKRKRTSQGFTWEVISAPHCTCPPLSTAEKRSRNVKHSLLPDDVIRAVENTVTSKSRASKVSDKRVVLPRLGRWQKRWKP
jgi:hypothetical protein